MKIDNTYIEHIHTIKPTLGKQAQTVTPFHNLRIEDLKHELQARGVNDVRKPKPELQQQLRQLLEGIHRVPSLLLLNPLQPLTEIHLSRYTVLTSEPLHDLKGHLHNILEEIPYILNREVQQKCKDLQEARLGQKVSAADMRATVISLYELLLKETTDSTVLDLLKTVVKISEILYLGEENRSPKQVLALYNNAWLHMELCMVLFPNPKKLTRRKLFGTYVHALTAHAPLQFETVCQKSINAENQERLFGQGRKAAEMASNRHPQNVITTVLLRLQAKKETGKMLHSVNEADSQVSKAALNVHIVEGSTFAKRFITQRKHSWQAHLERISPFLLEGEGVWWNEEGDSYKFYDGATDPPYHSQGPKLLHFRDATIENVIQRQRDCWKKAIDQSIPLPTTILSTYDDQGEFLKTLPFHQESLDDEVLTDQEYRSISCPCTTEDSSPNSSITDNKDQHQTEHNTDTYMPPIQLDTTALTTQESSNSSQQPETKLAKAIHKAIGPTTELRSLDTIRTQIKLAQHKGHTVRQPVIKQHETLKLQLKEQVTNKKRDLKAHIKQKECDYISKHNCLPRTEDDTEYASSTKQLTYVKWLLSVWENI